jgi:hypothetical protein
MRWSLIISLISMALKGPLLLLKRFMNLALYTRVVPSASTCARVKRWLAGRLWAAGGPEVGLVARLAAWAGGAYGGAQAATLPGQHRQAASCSPLLRAGCCCSTARTWIACECLARLSMRTWPGTCSARQRVPSAPGRGKL